MVKVHHQPSKILITEVNSWKLLWLPLFILLTEMLAYVFCRIYARYASYESAGHFLTNKRSYSFKWNKGATKGHCANSWSYPAELQQAIVRIILHLPPSSRSIENNAMMCSHWWITGKTGISSHPASHFPTGYGWGLSRGVWKGCLKSRNVIAQFFH